MVGTNCYVVYNENTKECFVVDPAAPSAPLVEFIQTEGLQLQGILLTHGHFDHIMGIDTLRVRQKIRIVSFVFSFLFVVLCFTSTNIQHKKAFVKS